MATLKTSVNDASVTAFLDAVAVDEKRNDCYQLLEMMSAVTGKPPKMWGTAIIGFGSYHYVYASGREGDWPVVGFSPRAQNISIYIMPGFSRYKSLLEKLGKHKTGKSCLYIKRLDDEDTGVLRQLVEGSVANMKEMYQCS